MRRVVVVLCLVLVSVVVVPVQPVAAAERLDQENLSYSSVVQPVDFMPRNQFWAQTFVPQVSGDLTSVRFGIGSSAAATVTMEIFALQSGGGPLPRTVLARPCDPNALVTFTFDRPAQVMAGVAYFFAVYTNEKTTDACASEADAYPAGTALIMFNDGPAIPDPPLDPNATHVVLFMDHDGSRDYLFQTFVDPNTDWLFDNLLAMTKSVPIAADRNAQTAIRRTLVVSVQLAELLEQRDQSTLACVMLKRMDLEVRMQTIKRRITASDGAALLAESLAVRRALGCRA